MAELMASITIRIPEVDKQKLVELAAADDRTLSQLLRLIVKDYLKNKI